MHYREATYRDAAAIAMLHADSWRAADRGGEDSVPPGGSRVHRRRYAWTRLADITAASKLPDVLEHGLDLVVCGSAAGTRSASAGCYYAGPGNKFWRTLADTCLTPRRLTPAEFRRLPEFGIGLTDLVKGQSGADAAIQFHASERERFRRRILEYQPRHLCFNGKRAAQEYFATRAVEYGPRSEKLGTTSVFVAPSTSGAANGVWDVECWHRLARLVRDRPPRLVPTARPGHHSSGSGAMQP